MYLKQFLVEGMGCESYLIADHAAKVAAVIDPDRDVIPYLDAAAEHGFTITHIIETHLHADHVSGNTDLAARTGAPVYIHEAAQASFPHHPLHEGEVLMIGSIEMLVLHTPGHTPDSVTLVLTDAAQSPDPAAVLTGDTLFVGDVGRPDLVGEKAAREMAAQLHESLFNKVLALDSALTVYPGHGAGSLCGRSIGSARSTTIGAERTTNPALAINDKDVFIHDLITSLPEQPGNHRLIKALNRRGPVPLGPIEPRALSIDDALPHFEHGAALLDTRVKEEYIAAHVPGSVYLTANEKLSGRIGFILPLQVRIVLLMGDEQDYGEIVRSLARVGYEDVAGCIDGGIGTWEAAGLPTTSGDVEDINPIQLKEMLQSEPTLQVVDVREPWEFRIGHVPDARLMPLGELQRYIDDLDPERPVALICASGVRSLSAAALLGRCGFKKMYNVAGGTHAWIDAGLPIERG
jgi:hydroxyacylglutathione hydrolase